MSITLDFSGKTALITGASQGIGAQMAEIKGRAANGREPTGASIFST